MRKTRLSIACGFFVWVAFAGLAVAQSTGAAEWKVLSRSIRVQIENTESELSELKVDVRQSFGVLEEDVRSTRKSADQWQEAANLESDAQRRVFALRARDGKLIHVQRVIEAERLLSELSRIDEGLEADQKLLASFQKTLEELREDLKGDKANPQQLSELRKLAALFENDLTNSRQSIVDLRQGLTERESMLTEQGEKIRARLAELGDPQDRVKQLEKDLVNEARASNRVDEIDLAMIIDQIARTSKILIKTIETLKTQEQIVDFQ
jgi:DNA repair exonuclease SbcCD ATPase subunit